MKYTLPLGFAAILSVAASAGVAGHANPWASADDTLQERFHDTNQSKSIGTPGQDEMRGRMEQKANGKLGESGQSQRDNKGGGKGRGH